jgi:hypothetical protein
MTTTKTCKPSPEIGRQHHARHGAANDRRWPDRARLSGVALMVDRTRGVRSSRRCSRDLNSGPSVRSAFGRIVLQKSFCTGDQKFSGLQARM